MGWEQNATVQGDMGGTRNIIRRSRKVHDKGGLVAFKITIVFAKTKT